MYTFWQLNAVCSFAIRDNYFIDIRKRKQASKSEKAGASIAATYREMAHYKLFLTLKSVEFLKIKI